MHSIAGKHAIKMRRYAMGCDATTAVLVGIPSLLIVYMLLWARIYIMRLHIYLRIDSNACCFNRTEYTCRERALDLRIELLTYILCNRITVVASSVYYSQ
jgi:hypothetical protein